MSPFFRIVFGLTLAVTVSASSPRDVSTGGSDRGAETGAVTLTPFGRISSEPVNESSGMVTSRRTAGLYWTHNDSGDGPKLYPITASGEAWPGSPPAGITVGGARAVDWEDLCLDDRGNLVIADTGNNDNLRRDLTVYFVPEPDPAGTPTIDISRAVRVAYPDQDGFPPTLKNFDCEAVFWADGKLHFLSKNRGDTNTTLYRLDTDARFPKPNVLTKLRTFPIGGQVTAADTSADGRRLTVLTYSNVWLFERDGAGLDFFSGITRMLPIRAWQCEAICFEPKARELRLSNEQRDLYLLPFSELRRTAGQK